MIQDLLLLSKDTPIARITDGVLEILELSRIPLFLKRTGDMSVWLKSRAIDGHRVNSRLLKRALRLENKDDISTVLTVNAAAITDNYWVKPLKDTAICYDDIRFKVNLFDSLALTGDVNSFNQPPSKTPELTNIGSYEKCWRLEEGSWWMYKAGKQEELFSELLAYKVGNALGLPMAEYRSAGTFIKSMDFTGNASVDFEPVASIIGEETNYVKIYDSLHGINESIADQYVKMCYFDGLILNMDRHEFNFGILRDSDTGQVLSLAPLFDHNIALVARGYPSHAPGDMLISDFSVLLQHTGKLLCMPKLTKQDLSNMIKNIPFELPITEEVKEPLDFTARYLLKRQEVLETQNRGLLHLSFPKEI